ncbi:MAG: cytochrome c [Saprospiraceae bacterium]
MKKIYLTIVILFTGISLLTFLNGCATSQAMADKSGAQLWGENCVRCHNTPSPADYSDGQWEAIGMHMRLRTQTLSPDEMNKIVAFLQSGN